MSKPIRVTVIPSHAGIDFAETFLSESKFHSEEDFAKSLQITSEPINQFLHQQPLPLDSFIHICKGLKARNWKTLAQLNSIADESGKTLLKGDEERKSDEKWKLVQEIVRVPVSSRQLNGVDLSNADMRCASLSDANLRGANLRGINFRCADLSGADLSEANFRGADFKGNEKGFSNVDLETFYFNRRLKSPDCISVACVIRDFAAALRLARDLFPTGSDRVIKTGVRSVIDFAVDNGSISSHTINCTLYINHACSNLVSDLDFNDIVGCLNFASNEARLYTDGHHPNSTKWGIPASELALSLLHINVLMHKLAKARSFNASVAKAGYSGSTNKHDFILLHVFVHAVKLAIAASDPILRGSSLSGAVVENAQFGLGVGLTIGEKLELQKRGALFEPDAFLVASL